MHRLAILGPISQHPIHTRTVFIAFIRICRVGGEQHYSNLPDLSLFIYGNTKVVFAGSAAILVQFYAP
jgi:hypothetical protein